jgi:glycosyltransferase involved in cell wall biosynthesis
VNNLNLPLVSIVFTSYNHQVFVRQAIDSLLSQTYQNFELIIVDDNSTDSSQDIIKEYQHVKNIKLLLRESNSGSYVKASNYGAGYANGKYILFAQCDDFAEPTQLQKLVNAFEKNSDIGVSFCRSNLIDKDGIVFDNDYRIREKLFRTLCINDTIIHRQLMRHFLSRSCVIPNLSAALIERELYLSTGGLSEDYLVAADWAFWLDLSEKCNFSYIAEPLNNFRQHDTTIRNTVKIKRQILEIYTIFYKHINKYKLSAKIGRTMRIGAATVWLSYLNHNIKAWVYSFPSLFKSTFKYEKNILFYLIIGGFSKFKELIIRDSKNGA